VDNKTPVGLMLPNQRNRILGGVVFCFLFAGCAHLSNSPLTASRTIPVEEQLQKVEILLLAVDVARSMNFPEVTRFDKENGIVDFGSFGTQILGLTAQVRAGSGKKNVEVAVQRVKGGSTRSIDIPLPVEEIVNEYANKFNERLQQTTVVRTKENPPVELPSTPEVTSLPPSPEELSKEVPPSPEPLVIRTLPEIKVEPIAPANPSPTYLLVTRGTNVRAEGNVKSKIVATLKKGEKVEKLDESGNWFNVKLSSGEKGWVSKGLVKEVD
jgi:hypothetical protein